MQHCFPDPTILPFHVILMTLKVTSWEDTQHLLAEFLAFGPPVIPSFSFPLWPLASARRDVPSTFRLIYSALPWKLDTA